MTNEDLHDKEPRSSTEIESDIRQTRGRMDATLDELNNRMSARSLLNSALDWWESRNAGAPGCNATSEAYETVARRVRENPMPSLLIGFGLVWMIIDATTKNDEETGSTGEWTDFRSREGVRMRVARHPLTPSNTSGSKRKPGTVQGSLRARRINLEKQKKQPQGSLIQSRRKLPL